MRFNIIFITGVLLHLSVTYAQNFTIGGDESQIDPACTSSCQTAVDFFTKSTCADPNAVDVLTPQCLCNDQFGQAIVSCASCEVNHATLDRTQLQKDLDSITSSCKAAGHPFGKALVLTNSGLLDFQLHAGILLATAFGVGIIGLL